MYLIVIENASHASTVVCNKYKKPCCSLSKHCPPLSVHDSEIFVILLPLACKPPELNFGPLTNFHNKTATHLRSKPRLTPVVIHSITSY